MNKFRKIINIIFIGPLFAFTCYFLKSPQKISAVMERGSIMPITDFFLILGLSSFGIIIAPIWDRFFGKKYIILASGFIGALLCLGTLTIIRITATLNTHKPCNANQCSFDNISSINVGLALLIALSVITFFGICSSITAYFYKKLKYPA